MRVLILGGTQEAFQLAEQLAALDGVAFISSLAGRTREPRLPTGQVRTGGFGGVKGLAGYLRSERITHLVNATHPFAAQISANAVEAAQVAGVPLLRLLRPAWTARHDDRWVAARDTAEAAEQCRRQGGRIFLTLGSGEVDAFAEIRNAHFLVRMVDTPERLPLSDYRVVAARGPFSLQDELRLLAEHHIGLIVAKNSGGEATYGKIAAARALGIEVIILRRPALPDVPSAATVEAALAFIDHATAPHTLRGV